MSNFSRKKLSAPVRIEEKLRKAREESHLSIFELSEKTHVLPKYLSAIEEGHFSELPSAGAHRTAYVKKYAEAVGLNSVAAVFQFCQEVEKEDYKESKQKINNNKFYSLPFIIRNFLAASFVLVFVVYMVWQVKGILDPPKLVVFTPEDGLVSSHISTLVQGEAEKESRVTVNGQEARINEKGQFEFPIDLSGGLNVIIIKATKKHGKTTTVTRNVVVRSLEVGVDIKK